VAAILASPATTALQPSVIELIETARQAAVQLLSAIIEPTFAAISQLLESTIRRIHYEDYSLHVDGSDGGPSKFITELQRNATHIQTELVSRFTCKDSVGPRMKTIVEKLLVLFVRHACLIHRFGEAGRLKLAGDMAEFEMAFTPFECKLSEVGAAYRQLRALRPLLFCDVQGIVNSRAVGEAITVSLVIHHLFSHAPEEILPPHNLKGWTFEQYSRWLDERTEAEKLRAIRESLEIYANSVKERGGLEFDPIYPIMLEMCDRT
jgi:hypothetical protein